MSGSVFRCLFHTVSYLTNRLPKPFKTGTYDFDPEDLNDFLAPELTATGTPNLPSSFADHPAIQRTNHFTIK